MNEEPNPLALIGAASTSKSENMGRFLEHVWKTEMERPHHDYSPSTLQSLEACPCYQSKQSDTPHPRTVIGKISHGVTETGEDNPELTDGDAEKVAECVDFFERRKQIFDENRDRYLTEQARPQDGTIQEFTARRQQLDLDTPQTVVLRETYLPIDDLVFTDVLQPPYGVPNDPRQVVGTTAGYIDSALIYYTETYAEVFDWKFGMWVVEQADNNLQGIAYALGMFKRYPKLKTVKYYFKQPNLDYITDHTIKREDIPALYLRIQVVVARARIARQVGDFDTAKAFVPACNFCAHIGRCPVVTQFACKVGSKFSPLDIPADITPTTVHDAANTKLGFQLAGVVEVWAKAFRNVVTNRVICRDAPPPDGYKLESRAPREITDQAKYKEVALRYLTEDEYNSTLTAAFGSVEELISTKAPRGQKTAQVEEFGKAVEECGAVKRKDSYTFLRAIPKKPTQENTNQ
jgi:hypothetical protein